MKKNYYLLIIACLTAFSMYAQDVKLPDGMTAITTSKLQLSVKDDLNKSKNNKPLIKMNDGSLIFSAMISDFAKTKGDELYICKNDVVTLIKDIESGPAGSIPQWMTVVGNKVFFRATTTEHGDELWVTDGTEDGTKMVKDIYPGNIGSNIFGITALDGNRCCFFAKDPDSELDPVFDLNNGDEWLWISDGTDAGTFRLADVPTRKFIDGFDGYLIKCGSKLFFSGYSKQFNETLWITDGTKAGTKAVTNINPKPSSPGSNFDTQAANIDWLMNVDDTKVIFRAETVAEKVGGNYGSEIWYSDGTEAGTKWVGVDYAAGETNGVPNNTEFAFPIAHNGKVYFRAKDGVHGCEPGITDFTPSGTHYITDVNQYNIESGFIDNSWMPESGVVWNNYIFCKGNGSWWDSQGNYHDSGFCLWRYNLAEDGAIVTNRQTKTAPFGYQYQANWCNDFEIYPGNNHDGASWFKDYDGRLYFRSQNSADNAELWVMDNVDATPRNIVDMEGNTSPHNLIVANDALYFVTGTTKMLYKYSTKSTGIKQPKSENSISIYPNPATDRLSINTDENIEQVEIINLVGSRVAFSKGNNKTINVSGLESGIYLVRIKTAQNNVFSEKLYIK